MAIHGLFLNKGASFEKLTRHLESMLVSVYLLHLRMDIFCVIYSFFGEVLGVTFGPAIFLGSLHL